MSEWLRDNETWDDLLRDQIGVIQPVKGYRFSMDAVLLAHFAAQYPARRVLDLGTGCGVIALLLASRLKTADITGLEIQEEQAERACRSIQANRLQDRIAIIHGDLRDHGVLPAQQYDLITANPPFFPRGQGKLPAQAAIAISRHEISCTLNDIFVAAAYWLAPDGRFCLILPPARQEDAEKNGDEQGLRLTRWRTVHPRRGEAANLVLMEYQWQGEDCSQTIMPPLYVYQENGEYTPEIISIYYD